MTSAKMPDRRKKTNVEPRYIMPMRLWSTVVNQLAIFSQRLGFATGMLTLAIYQVPPSTTTPNATVCALRFTLDYELLERLQICHQVGNVLWLQSTVGHLRAR